MIIRSSSAGNINHIAVQNINKIAEPQTPPIVESESSEKKVQEIPRVKRTGQENKKGNKRPAVENNRKSAFEILMEED